MSWIDTVEKQLQSHANAVRGIETILGVARAALAAGDHQSAANALGMIESVTESLVDGFTGKADPDSIKAALDKLIASVATADAATDAEIDRRFDKGST